MCEKRQPVACCVRMPLAAKLVAREMWQGLYVPCVLATKALPVNGSKGVMTIRIKEIVHQLPEAPHADLPSLAIDFCGLPCENPFFLASSSVCTNYEMVARAFDAGWAGVFYKTICLDEIKEVSPRFDVLHREGDKGDFNALRNMEQLSENPADVDFDILSRRGWLRRRGAEFLVSADAPGRHGQ